MELKPRTEYQWKVSVQSDTGVTADSGMHTFETGKRDEPWNAEWITCENTDVRHPVFCRSFSASKPVKKARLYISGLGLYEASLNGRKIGVLDSAMVGVLDKYLDDFMHDGNNAHAVFPGLVYITFPTELGTLYSARELNEIYEVCQHYEIPLYIDGARLGYGLMADGNDITLPYLARHCDVFYIGGTKIGALCGEAVVFTNRRAHKHFFSIQKQHGAVIAKGALIGLQFDALFKAADEGGKEILYYQLSRHAIEMAMRMKEIFRKSGYEFFIDSPTNQQFVIISNEEVERLSQHVEFTHWGQADKYRTICRFVTSWATTDEELDELERLCQK